MSMGRRQALAERKPENKITSYNKRQAGHHNPPLYDLFGTVDSTGKEVCVEMVKIGQFPSSAIATLH